MLLADGKAAPIAALKPGGKIVATNVKTGKTEPETVAAVLVRYDRDLYDLKVRVHGRTAVIDTTRNHLFWVPGTAGHGGRWVDAADLAHGTGLRASNAANIATVITGWVPSQSSGWMWDLSVPGNNDHDFYITTTAAPVLVHNSGCPITEYTTHARNQMASRSISEQMVVQGCAIWAPCPG